MFFTLTEVNICTTVDQCIERLNKNKDEIAFIISSDSLGENLVPEIHSMINVDTIYIFCANKQRHNKRCICIHPNSP